jgi:TonB family protein
MFLMRKKSSILLLSPRPLYGALYWAIGLVVLLFFFLPLTQAQTLTPSTSRDVVRSVLPDFQADAGVAGKTTDVIVNITIGERGQVTQAETAIDKSTLGNSCALAARQWIFVREIPAGTTGMLTFRFTPDGKVSATALFTLKSDPKDPVPKPLFQTTEGEAKWWEDLRRAGSEVVITHQQRADALRKVDEQIVKEIDRRTGGSSSDNDRIAVSVVVRKKFQPEFDAVYAEHNPKVVVAEDRFRALLREGNEKSLIEPLPSHRPIVVQQVKAKYTEEARLNKVQGSVLLSIVMEAGGTVSGIQVVRGLPDGLTEKAIEAVKLLMFIPASKNGKYIPSRGSIEYSFNLY